MIPQAWMQWIWLAITLVGLLVSAYLVMKLFRFEIRALLERAAKGQVIDPALLQWGEEMARGLRVAVIAIAALLAVFFVLRGMGHPAVAGWQPTRILDWLLEHGVRIVVVVAAAYIAIKVSNMLLAKVGLLIRAYDESSAAEIERQKRAHTISAVLQKCATVTITVVTALMLLSELNINTTPILTGLGVVGVALGFGAQQVIGDLLAGFFHIFENQIRVGDVAVINGTGGLVEDIRLRTTVLRGLDGTVHVFRNGSISTLSNMTKDFSYAVIDLGVAYKEDTDRVCRVVQEVVAEMQTDEKYGPSILEPVEVVGVDNFADSAVVVRFRIKTLPMKQWEVGREFRRRIKYRFDKEGIEIPFPHRSIYFGEASKPFSVAVNNSAEEAAAKPSSGTSASQA
ncbi:MAG: mechanosensitive ion channel family protein [Acidobacteria bacterium]|nr:mechanosensitive ion channel family protein [Acidobacteriota bacterium]